MKDISSPQLTKEEIEDIRSKYDKGIAIPDIIRGIVKMHPNIYPKDLTWPFMEAFDLRLGDVKIIDGWWPPDGSAEVDDQKLHHFIDLAIKERKAKDAT